MKGTLQIALLSALCSGQALAANPVTGVYVGLMGGGNVARSVDNYNYIPPILFTPPTNNLAILNTANPNAKLSFKVSGNGGGQIGYRFNCFRAEIEGLYATNSYGTITTSSVNVQNNFNGLTLTGHINAIAGFLNGFYDIYTPGSDSNIGGYLGLGVGYANIQNILTYKQSGFTLTTPPNYSVSQGSFAAQGIVGLNYYIDDFTSIGGDFRYITTSSIINAMNARPQIVTFDLNINFALDRTMS